MGGTRVRPRYSSECSTLPLYSNRVGSGVVIWPGAMFKHLRACGEEQQQEVEEEEIYMKWSRLVVLYTCREGRCGGVLAAAGCDTC